MLLPTEEASALCAETRAGVERGKHLDQTDIYGLLIPCLQYTVASLLSSPVLLSLQDVSDLRNELQRKELLVQKHLAKLHHWQQVLEDVSGQHRKPTDLPPPGPLAFLEQASASLPPAPLKPS